MNWPPAGPSVSWRVSIGEGYSSPVVLGDDVIVFHRPRKEGATEEESHGPEEAITCFDFATGRPRWEFRQPTSYQCKTHYSSGPYSTPVMDAERVYAFGTEGNFYCLARADGKLLWKRNLWQDYGLNKPAIFRPRQPAIVRWPADPQPGCRRCRRGSHRAR